MTQTEREELGRKIRDLRTRNGKSQEELGKFLDKSHAAVSDIERGKSEMSVSDLTKISQFFEVSVESFLNTNIYLLNPMSFSHSRAEIGISNEDRLKMLRAREEFRKKAMEAQLDK